MLGLLLACAAIAQGLSYWPGIMTWDAITQYSQALEGAYDDWHPPAMAWLWRSFIAIVPGPAPMYLLQLGLYWLGYCLIVRAALGSGRRIAAVAAVSCALMPFPLALMGSVLKDCLMEGFLLTGVGCLLSVRSERDWLFRLGGIGMLLMAGLLRFNAFLAIVSLLVACLPRHWRDTPWRLATAAVIWLLVAIVAMPLANRLIGAEKSDVNLSLVIFDLGGITRNSGVDMFPPLGIPDAVRVNARCYQPDRWDSYSPWGAPPCPINFDRVGAAMERSHAGHYATLLRAALAHPVAYARHRLVHFNLNSRFLVHDEVQGPVPDRATDNDWHFTVTRGPGLRFFNGLVRCTMHSPLCWPIWWIAIAIGLLAISPWLRSRSLIVPIALSAVLYGLGYLPFSVSSELRYHLWTITATGIAAAFTLSDLVAGTDLSRRRLVLSFSPAILVTLLCTIWRLS